MTKTKWWLLGAVALGLAIYHLFGLLLPDRMPVGFRKIALTLMTEETIDRPLLQS